MKRILLTSVLVPFGLAIGNGCGVDDGAPVTSGGVKAGGGESAGAAGDTGSGGSNSGSGGSIGVGGDTGMGGMGVGGNPVGVGGNPVGAGGMAGSGVGGMGGMAGAGGGMPVGEGLSDMGYPWKSSWWISGCQTKAGHDCITIPTCPGGMLPNFEDRGAVTKERFPVGGVAGTKYDVTFQVNGISEGKFYTGGTPALTVAPGNVNSANLDTFHLGVPAPGAVAPNNVPAFPVTSNYNVIKLTVMDSAGKEVSPTSHYYFNSFPQSSGAESHRTFHLSYSKTIEVVGGGFVEYLAEDSNCHAIDNCGDGDVSDTVCNAARGIPNEEANPLPPKGIDPSTHKPVDLATLNSVNGSQKPWHSQIIHLTITKVVAK